MAASAPNFGICGKTAEFTLFQRSNPSSSLEATWCWQKKNWKRSKKIFKWIDVLIRAAGTQKQGARWKKDGVGRI